MSELVQDLQFNFVVVGLNQECFNFCGIVQVHSWPRTPLALHSHKWDPGFRKVHSETLSTHLYMKIPSTRILLRIFQYLGHFIMKNKYCMLNAWKYFSFWEQGKELGIIFIKQDCLSQRSCTDSSLCLPLGSVKGGFGCLQGRRKCLLSSELWIHHEECLGFTMFELGLECQDKG